jgi:hypothetical protein
MSTTRFLFPDNSTDAKPVFESESAMLPAMTQRSQYKRSCTLPSVERSSTEKDAVMKFAEWSRAAASAVSPSVAQYKHYDVTLDWCEVCLKLLALIAKNLLLLVELSASARRTPLATYINS